MPAMTLPGRSRRTSCPVFANRPASRTSSRSSIPMARTPSPSACGIGKRTRTPIPADRKSTRLNSSHANISYAVFCLKKKNPTNDRGRSSGQREGGGRTSGGEERTPGRAERQAQSARRDRGKARGARQQDSERQDANE